MRWLDGITAYECGQTSGDGDGKGGWHAAVHGVAESEMTRRPNNNNNELKQRGTVKVIVF